MKIAIYGYGNLGRGVELALKNATDAELVGIFTRRAPSGISTLTAAPVYSADTLNDFKGEIDVLIICGGSATDLPTMTPSLASHFNVVDSFDTHAMISEHFARVDKAALDAGNIALISGGWDPGLFSLARLYATAVLPDGMDYTFWGKGISQGHSDAVRRIDGVVDARQYTIPIDEAINAVRGGKAPHLTTAQKHRRECYVVLRDGADAMRVEREIKEMPNYFADYDTTVHFVSEEELLRDHGGMPHGGSVIYSGRTGLNGENSHTVEFSLRLDSNPEFTGSVLVAYARAIHRMHNRGCVGCKTVFDVAPADLSPLSQSELVRRLL